MWHLVTFGDTSANVPFWNVTYCCRYRVRASSHAEVDNTPIKRYREKWKTYWTEKKTYQEFRWRRRARNLCRDPRKDWSRRRRVRSSTWWRRTIGRTCSDFEGEWFSDRKGRKRSVSCRLSTFFPSMSFRSWTICNRLDDAKFLRILVREIPSCSSVFQMTVFVFKICGCTLLLIRSRYSESKGDP